MSKALRILGIFLFLFVVIITLYQRVNSSVRTIDFETPVYKDLPNITDEKAHSGKYSSKVDATYDFSQGFEQKISFRNKLPKKVYASAWCYSLNYDPSTVFVIAIYSKDTCKFFHAKELDETIRQKNKWMKISSYADLPSNIDTSNKITVWVWNRFKSDTLFMDDLNVRIQY